MSAASERIVVIGGGIAGLASAALLARDGHRVTLLEARDELGGRAGTWERRGFRFDTGPVLVPHARGVRPLLPPVRHERGRAAGPRPPRPRLPRVRRRLRRARSTCARRAPRTSPSSSRSSPVRARRSNGTSTPPSSTYDIARRRFLYTNFDDPRAFARARGARRRGAPGPPAHDAARPIRRPRRARPPPPAGARLPGGVPRLLAVDGAGDVPPHEPPGPRTGRAATRRAGSARSSRASPRSPRRRASRSSRTPTVEAIELTDDATPSVTGVRYRDAARRTPSRAGAPRRVGRRPAPHRDRAAAAPRADLPRAVVGPPDVGSRGRAGDARRARQRARARSTTRCSSPRTGTRTSSRSSATTRGSRTRRRSTCARRARPTRPSRHRATRTSSCWSRCRPTSRSGGAARTAPATGSWSRPSIAPIARIAAATGSPDLERRIVVRRTVGPGRLRRGPALLERRRARPGAHPPAERVPARHEPFAPRARPAATRAGRACRASACRCA